MNIRKSVVFLLIMVLISVTVAAKITGKYYSHFHYNYNLSIRLFVLTDNYENYDIIFQNSLTNKLSAGIISIFDGFRRSGRSRCRWIAGRCRPPA